MSAKRFTINSGDDTPKVVKAHKVDKPKPAVPRKPTHEKEGCELDRIRVELDPARFMPEVVPALLTPFNGMEKHVIVVSDLLSDAIRRSNNGDDVHFVYSQWRAIGTAHNILLGANAHLLEGAVGLEWSSTLSSRLLKYLIDNPQDADKVRQTLNTLLKLMSKFAARDGGGEEEAHV
jgi:hypothetical protein